MIVVWRGIALLGGKARRCCKNASVGSIPIPTPMRRCPRHGSDSVEAVQAVDSSLCYGPCEAHVACEFFNSAVQLSIKSNMVVMDVTLDNNLRVASLKPSSATFVVYLEDIVEIKSFSSGTSGPEVVEEEMEEGIALLLNTSKVCAIEGISDDLCLKAIHSAWQTHLLRLAARVPKSHSAGVELGVVRAYYREVMKGVEHSRTVSDLSKLLQEFSREVLTNSPLKIMVFDTKEVLGGLVALWQTLLTKTPRFGVLAEDPKWRQLVPQERVRRTAIYTQLKATIDESVSLEVLQDDFNRYLLTIVAERMKLLALVAQSLAALFFGSELLTLRAEAVVSDDPDSALGLSAWLGMLSQDVLVSVCQVVGLDTAAIDGLLSSVAAATTYPETQRRSKRGGSWSTPVKIVPMPPSASEKGFRVDAQAIGALPQLAVDVSGRQTLLLFEIFRVVDSQRALVLSWSRHSLSTLLVNVKHSRALSTQRTRAAVRRGTRLLSERQEAQIYGAHKLASVSTFFVQHNGWQDCVVRWVQMLLEGLDAFLSAHSIRLQNGVAQSVEPLLTSSRNSFSSFSVASKISALSLASLSTFGGAGGGGGGREQRIARDMALLVYLSHIVYFMAVDASAVREVLLRETLSHWQSIANILHLLAPLTEQLAAQPPEPAPAPAPTPSPARVTPKSGALAGMLTSSLQYWMPSAFSPSAVSSTAAAAPSPSQAPTQAPTQAGQLSLFSAPSTPVRVPPQLDLQGGLASEPGLRSHRSARSMLSTRTARSVRSARSTRSRAGSAWDMPGVPLHGLSTAQWRLLLLTKLRVEALLFDVLKLQPEQVYAEACPEALPDEEQGSLLGAENDDDDMYLGAFDASPRADLDQLVDTPVRPKASAFDPMDVDDPPVARWPLEELVVAQSGASEPTPSKPPLAQMPPLRPAISSSGLLSARGSARHESTKSLQVTTDLAEGELPPDSPMVLETPQTRAKKRVRLNL